MGNSAGASEWRGRGLVPQKLAPLGGAVARVFPNVSLSMCPLKLFDPPTCWTLVPVLMGIWPNEIIILHRADTFLPANSVGAAMPTEHKSTGCHLNDDGLIRCSLCKKVSNVGIEFLLFAGTGNSWRCWNIWQVRRTTACSSWFACYSQCISDGTLCDHIRRCHLHQQTSLQWHITQRRLQ